MTTNQPTTSLTIQAMTRRAAADPAMLVKRIELLLLDVDGVLTDGGLWYTEQGDELKRFHVRDGTALKLWHELGFRTAVLSGRTSSTVRRRAEELGIGTIVQGQCEKLAAFRRILQDVRLDADQVCAMGDDWPDLPVLRACGLAVAVADATAEVRAVASYVTTMPGGRGAVREAIEWILKLRGDWPRIMERFQ